MKLYIIFFLHAPLSGRYGDVLTFPDTLIVLISLSPGFKIISLNSHVTGFTWNKVTCVLANVACRNELTFRNVNPHPAMVIYAATVCWLLASQYQCNSFMDISFSYIFKEASHQQSNSSVDISFSHIFKEVLRQMLLK